MAGLSWDKAKSATRDAWKSVEKVLPGDADGDRTLTRSSDGVWAGFDIRNQPPGTEVSDSAVGAPPRRRSETHGQLARARCVRETESRPTVRPGPKTSGDLFSSRATRFGSPATRINTTAACRPRLPHASDSRSRPDCRGVSCMRTPGPQARSGGSYPDPTGTSGWPGLECDVPAHFQLGIEDVHKTTAQPCSTRCQPIHRGQPQ